MSKNLIKKVREWARDSAQIGVLAAGLAAAASNLSCSQGEIDRMNRDWVAMNTRRQVIYPRQRVQQGLTFDLRLPVMVFCNYWNDNGDGIISPRELVGEGKHTFDCGETFQIYGLNKTGQTVSAEINIYNSDGNLVSTSGHITVQPGGSIWSERSFAHNSEYQEMYTAHLVFDGRTINIENFKLNPSEKYRCVIDNKK